MRFARFMMASIVAAGSMLFVLTGCGNEGPSDEERQKAIREVKEIEAEIEKIQNEISTVDGKISKIDGEIQELQRGVNKLKD